MVFGDDERMYNLISRNEKDFSLLKNTANALCLQLNEPLHYDLTIPRISSVGRLVYLFQEDLQGNKILPSEVNILSPRISWYRGDVGGGLIECSDILAFPKRVGRGLEFCFKLNNRNDHFPLFFYLENNKDFFGKEDEFYRFREGARKKIENKVNKYFNKKELRVFNDFGDFIKPYLERLDSN